MKLKFIADAYYNGEHVYKKGQVVEIDNSKGMASRWLRRNLAVEVEQKYVELEVQAEIKVEEVSPEEVVVEIEEVKVESPKRRKSKKEE